MPQMALPVSTSQITRELSSCPPSDARYRPSCENDSSATFTLCRLMRCTTLRACKSQTIMSALNPMLVICPDARNAPSREIARQDTSSLCPCRNDCEYVSPSSFTTIVAPRGYAIVLPFGCKTSPPLTFPANPTTDSRGRWSVMAIADERKRGSASVRTRSRRGASPNARESMCRRPARSSITPREGAKTGARRKRAVISQVARDSRLSRSNRTKKALERPPPVSRRIREGTNAWRPRARAFPAPLAGGRFPERTTSAATVSLLTDARKRETRGFRSRGEDVRCSTVFHHGEVGRGRRALDREREAGRRERQRVALAGEELHGMTGCLLKHLIDLPCRLTDSLNNIRISFNSSAKISHFLAHKSNFISHFCYFTTKRNQMIHQ